MTASFIPDAVEAMVALGRRCRRRAVDRGVGGQRPAARPAVDARVGARCRSMWLAAHGDVVAAAAMAREAMVHHERLPMPFERARTLLLLGQLAASSTPEGHRERDAARGVGRLRGHGRTAVGRPRPRRARPHQGRAQPRSGADALRATGGRAGGVRHDDRDVAAALFISPKTVETNLARIYRKLGHQVAGRTGPCVRRRPVRPSRRETPLFCTEMGAFASAGARRPRPR